MKRLVQELLDRNRIHSELFVGQKTARDRHHANHPTNIAAFKCMDGRVNLASLTETPIGIIRPFRNIGGIFDLGWTALNAQLDHYVKTSNEKGRKILFLVTYHFAEGSRHRGCRGHEYDVERAIRSAEGIVSQIRRVFDGDPGIYPVLLGVETDRQKLIFHGRKGESLAMPEMEDDFSELPGLIRSFYPDMHPEIVPDLVPLLRGNIRHLSRVRAEGAEPDDQEHGERIIAIGQGFEWLPYNWALVINDLELTLDDTVGKAAGIIKDNIRARRVPKGRGLLLASVPYEVGGYERRLAVERARHLRQLGLESIRKFHPDLCDYFEPLTAVMNWQTRKLEILEG